ncbi:MAG: ExbD/TolR family protein [Betaproteobacteria bacterium AqS2]|uniref:ExbD/TolR family protein n=1 Tax=Candidatus Amphirhobacter heronislandensis TaxID=1732024 RepID=A0A930UFG8_9GAMM|nr:ExbD/TolR family protein [Betaproteobacteria bacterium AqS2]
MRKARSNSRLQSQINVVPYLDVMLVLLVIFMVTAPLINQAVIDLPPAGDVSATQRQEALEIQLPADGGYLLKDYNFGAEEISFNTLPDLLQLLRERRQTFPGAPILISADRTIAYEKVVEVLALLHREDIKNVGLVTRIGE